MKSIGEIYFDNSFFLDEASKTIGAPAIGPDAMEIIKNRREVKGRLTLDGQTHLEKIRRDIQTIFNTENVKIVWDKFCGCSMCPCSPGYRIKIDREFRSLNKYRFSLYVNQQGEYDLKKPQYTFEIGSENIIKLENSFTPCI